MLNFGLLYGSINKISDAFKPVAKSMADFGESMSKISKVLASYIAKVEPYANGDYAPESEAEKDFLDHVIVSDIMLS